MNEQHILLTDNQADAIVESLFEWFYDMWSETQQRLMLSRIACSIESACSIDMTIGALNAAYERAKAKRAVPRKASVVRP